VSHLQETLKRLLPSVQSFKISAPIPVKLKAESDKLVGNPGGEIDPKTTGKLQAHVAAMVRAGKVGDVSRRDLRMSCITITHDPMPPAADPEIGSAILEEVNLKRRRAAFFSLLDTYLDTFDPADAKTRWLANMLSGLAASWPWRPNDLWHGRIKRFNLLDVDAVPRQLAIEIMADPNRQQSILQEAGLSRGHRSQSKLALSAFNVACDMVANLSGAKAKHAQIALLAWNGINGSDGRFPSAWLNICRACLEPWRSNQPDDNHKAALIDSLQKLGKGDPRTSERQTMWGQVADQAPVAYDVIIKWLTEVSVMQFLEIVDRSLTDPDARRMWAYRRAFWTSYLQNKNGPKIEKAWVAFGEEGAALAQQIARTSKDISFKNFGRQREKSRRHSALIMQIGDFLIVDWSHSGMYNVWKRHEGGPAFFKTNYEPGQLDAAPLKDSHVAPRHYTWQKRLASIIEGRNFFTEKPEWRPRGV